MYSSNGTDKMKDEDQVDKILFKKTFLEPSTPNQFFFSCKLSFRPEILNSPFSLFCDFNKYCGGGGFFPL